MTEFVDVALTDDVRLPYLAGAESVLAAVAGSFADDWEALAAAFAGLTLTPLFDTTPVEDIAAMADAARERSGEELPDLFAWFAIPLEFDTLADAVAAAVQELPHEEVSE